jgi:DNA-binding NarL/FixJ family response regulator
MITLLLIEMEILVRAGLRAVLERESGLRVVGEADHPSAAVAAMAQLGPDIVLTEVCFDGEHRLVDVRGLDGRTRLVVVTSHASRYVVGQALRSGVRGYVLKRSPPDHLVAAVRHVALGEHYLDPSLGATLANRVNAELSDREQAVLALVAAGNTSSEIASALHVSRRTVEAVRSSIRTKLNIRNNADLCAYARRNGLMVDHHWADAGFFG